jgi:hypothetical protein
VLILWQGTHLVMGVHQVRLALAAGRELGTTQLTNALARGKRSWDAKPLASASKLQALKAYADHPSKANLAHTSHIQPELGFLLNQLPPSLASSFQQLHSHASMNLLASPATQHQNYAQAGPSSANQQPPANHPPPTNQVNPPPSTSGQAYYGRVSRGMLYLVVHSNQYHAPVLCWAGMHVCTAITSMHMPLMPLMP